VPDDNRNSTKLVDYLENLSPKNSELSRTNSLG